MTHCRRPVVDEVLVGGLRVPVESVRISAVTFHTAGTSLQGRATVVGTVLVRAEAKSLSRIYEALMTRGGDVLEFESTHPCRGGAGVPYFAHPAPHAPFGEGTEEEREQAARALDRFAPRYKLRCYVRAFKQGPYVRHILNPLPFAPPQLPEAELEVDFEAAGL